MVLLYRALLSSYKPQNDHSERQSFSTTLFFAALNAILQFLERVIKVDSILSLNEIAGAGWSVKDSRYFCP